LSQATVHNINVLSEKLSQAESNNHKLKEEITNLKAEVHKRRKVDDETTPLQETILDQHAKLYDVRMECFNKVKKMADKVKMTEKHLDIVSQTHQKIRNLQENIIELDEWRSPKRDIPNSLPLVKIYDIIVYTMAMEECQDLASRFEENARKDLSRMMDLYEKTTYDIQRYIQWPEINFEENHPVPITVFEEIEKDFERVKAEVQTKKEFSFKDIQELLVKPSMEYSHYTAFVQKFVISMEEYRKCNIALDIKKTHIFNSKEENILLQYEAWSKHFRRK
jgi:hypothetical protein